MPWKPRSKRSLNLEVAMLADQEGTNTSALCRRFGIRRPTGCSKSSPSGHEWLERSREDGPEAPILAVRLQELFGQTETPRIANGRVPLTLHLLSPAQRPVQITQDLANFWANTYHEVRKDMRGRYPKHYWPEDPLEATPTHTTKAQMEADV